MLCIAVFATWLDRVFLDTSTGPTSSAALRQPAVVAIAQYVTDSCTRTGRAAGASRRCRRG
jgi:hypothetical protein